MLAGAEPRLGVKDRISSEWDGRWRVGRLLESDLARRIEPEPGERKALVSVLLVLLLLPEEADEVVVVVEVVVAVPAVVGVAAVVGKLNP